LRNACIYVHVCMLTDESLLMPFYILEPILCFPLFCYDDDKITESLLSYDSN